MNLFLFYFIKFLLRHLRMFPHRGKNKGNQFAFRTFFPSFINSGSVTLSSALDLISNPALLQYVERLPLTSTSGNGKSLLFLSLFTPSNLHKLLIKSASMFGCFRTLKVLHTSTIEGISTLQSKWNHIITSF